MLAGGGRRVLALSPGGGGGARGNEKVAVLLLDPSAGPGVKRTCLLSSFTSLVIKSHSASGGRSSGFLCHDLFALLARSWFSHFPYLGSGFVSEDPFPAVMEGVGLYIISQRSRLHGWLLEDEMKTKRTCVPFEFLRPSQMDSAA